MQLRSRHNKLYLTTHFQSPFQDPCKHPFNIVHPDLLWARKTLQKWHSECNNLQKERLKTLMETPLEMRKSKRG